jgi:hypothetical protein
VTFWQAAEKVLTNRNQPMTAREIFERAVDRGLIDTRGKTPLATLEAMLYMHSKRDPRLERVFEQGATRAKRGSVRWRLLRRPSAPK